MNQPGETKVRHFEIPKNILSDNAGYSFFSTISLLTYLDKGAVIFFDFSANEWFDANLCSVLGVLIGELEKRKNIVVFFSINENVERIFRHNGFYQHIEQEYKRDVNISSVIEYRRFHLNDVNAFQSYITEGLLQHEDFPKISRKLSDEIARALLELFNNAHIHGKTENIYTCGQFFARSKILKFTISDVGVTIRKNVNDFLKLGRAYSGVDSIKWAVQEGHTTKTGQIPGGLGLSLIREFLRHNKGKIQIVSSDGFWEEREKTITSHKLDHRFLGTIVSVEFNLDDNNYYILASEIDLNDIF